MSGGELILLRGNIAREGIFTREGRVPRQMTCFRGRARRFARAGEAAEAAGRGEIGAGSAVVIGDPVSGEDWRRLLQSVGAAGLAGKLCIVTEEEPPADSGEAALFWYGGACRRRFADALLYDDDVVEYDLTARCFTADLTQEGEAARTRGADPGAAVITPLDADTWVITEKYSRMFLLRGHSGSLLIDTAFGGVELRAVAAELCGHLTNVALTHGHWDHCGGVRQLPDLWLAPEDFAMLPWRRTDPGGETYSGECRLLPLSDGQIFDLGGRTVEAIACPGHTPGGMVFLDRERRMLFAGDSVAEGPTYLFLDECAAPVLVESLRRLLARSGEFDAIYSAHRRMRLDAGDIRHMIECIELAQRGELTGHSACVAGAARRCRKYSWCGVSVFLPDGAAEISE